MIEQTLPYAQRTQAFHLVTITFIQTSVSSSHNLANDDRKRPDPDVKTNTQSWRKFALGVCKLTKQDHLRIMAPG